MQVVEQVLIPETICREPVGRLLLSCGEVLLYRCVLERDGFIAELNEDDHIVLEE